jgi:hypothetical protein
LGIVGDPADLIAFAAMTMPGAGANSAAPFLLFARLLLLDGVPLLYPDVAALE